MNTTVDVQFEAAHDDTFPHWYSNASVTFVCFRC